MTALLLACRRLLRLVGHIERWIGVSLLIGIVLAITTQVFTRYALNRPIIWVEEFSVYAFIWGTFLGASLGLKYGRHVKIETYVSHLPARGQAAARTPRESHRLLRAVAPCPGGREGHCDREPLDIGVAAVADPARLVLLDPDHGELLVNDGDVRIPDIG